MSSNTRDDLIAALRRTPHPLFVVGTGVSIGAVGGPKAAPAATWVGLIEDGLRRAKVYDHRSEKWFLAQRALLDEAEEGGNVSELLAVASTIEKVLARPGGEWAKWLSQTIGKLKGTHLQVAEALVRLGQGRLATTNYDHILTQASNRDLQPVHWKDARKMAQVARGERQGVMHLHGHWDAPESVVFGDASYGEVVRSKHAQALQNALGALQTLVFVGFGGGLEDPNFGRLLSALETFKNAEHQHFRLCLKRDVSALKKVHPPAQRIVLVPYGDQHSDLGPFLAGLAAGIGGPLGNETSKRIGQQVANSARTLEASGGRGDKHEPGAAARSSYDIFLSHASEDKVAFVRPLLRALREQGLTVWYDEEQITGGDDVRSKINEGIRASGHCVLVVSPHLMKFWPEAELSAFFAKQAHSGKKYIIPVTLNLEWSVVLDKYPLLGGRVFLKASDGLKQLAKNVVRAVGSPNYSNEPESASDQVSTSDQTLADDEACSTILADILRPAHADPVLRALATKLDCDALPDKIVKACFEQPDYLEVPQMLHQIWQGLKTRHSITIFKSWVHKLLPALMSRRSVRVSVSVRHPGSNEFVEIPVSTYATTELILAAYSGRPAQLCLDKFKDASKPVLDSPYRMDLAPTTITGEQAARNLTATHAEQTFRDAAWTKFDKESEIDTEDWAVVNDWRTQRAQNNGARDYFAFKPPSRKNRDGVHPSWAKAFWQCLPESAKVDVAILSVAAPDDDFIKFLPARIERWITPIFEEDNHDK